MNMDLQKEDFSYGGIYRATVLDNNDPSKLGRVKVNVFGVYDSIAAADLPWAVPMQPIGPGAGSGFGVFSVPEIGSIVFVMFEGGDVYQPIVIGSAPDEVHGLPSERSTNYPNRRVIKTKVGVVIYIDDTDRKIRVTHPTGKYVEIGSDGNVTVAADETVTGDVNVSGKTKSTGEVRSDDKFNVNGTPGTTGSFLSKDDKTVTVKGGLVTQIV